jgi:hypothetical protein
MECARCPLKGFPLIRSKKLHLTDLTDASLRSAAQTTQSAAVLDKTTSHRDDTNQRIAGRDRLKRSDP